MRRISDLSNRSAQSRQSRFSRDSTALMSAIGSLLCCPFWRRVDAELEVVALRHQLLLPPLRQAPAAVFKFRGDRIAEVWVLGDIYGLINQLKAN